MENERNDSITIAAPSKGSYINIGKFEKECEHCGIKFNSKTNYRKYCSQSCAVKFYNKTKNILKGSKIGQTKKCLWCNSSYQDYSKNGCGKYCCTKCHDYAHWESSIRERLKRKSIDKKLPYNLEKGDIIIPKFCPYLKIPLVIASEFHFNKPSVDRIIPEKGYVKGNIEVMSMAVNGFKSDMPLNVWEIISKRFLKNG